MSALALFWMWMLVAMTLDIKITLGSSGAFTVKEGRRFLSNVEVVWNKMPTLPHASTPREVWSWLSEQSCLCPPACCCCAWTRIKIFVDGCKNICLLLLCLDTLAQDNRKHVTVSPSHMLAATATAHHCSLEVSTKFRRFSKYLRLLALSHSRIEIKTRHF